MPEEHKIFGRVQCTDGLFYKITKDMCCKGCGKKLTVTTGDITEDEETDQQYKEYLSDKGNSQSTCDSQ